VRASLLNSGGALYRATIFSSPGFLTTRWQPGRTGLRAFGLIHGPKMMKGGKMNNQNRVLIRRGARELTPTESEIVNGGFITFSLCTSSPSPDGDQHVGEVGC
jgi:hypothetical protein